MTPFEVVLIVVVLVLPRGLMGLARYLERRLRATGSPAQARDAPADRA